MTSPLASTTSSMSRYSRMPPYLTAWMPPALLAIMPPRVAMLELEGSTGKNRPWGARMRLSSSPTMPGCTRACQSPGQISSTALSCVMSSEMPPRAGMGLPSRLEPPPQAVTGTRRSLAQASTRLTSAVLRGQTTASGARGGQNDSSRAWVSRAYGLTEQRSGSSSSPASAARS